MPMLKHSADKMHKYAEFTENNAEISHIISLCKNSLYRTRTLQHEFAEIT